VYSLRRKSFVSMMLKLAREREAMSVVTDQIGSPTFSRDLAVATASVVDRLGPSPADAALAARGIYHAAGRGECSRADLALAALELDPKRAEHRVVTVTRVTADAFPAPARRPRASPLSCVKLEAKFGVSLPPWRDALERALRA
jgi:dTDP-4-dehydrorhamnose reductase